jgi:hypothetical protein
MTHQNDPDPQRPRRYSLSGDSRSMAAPILVAVALILFIGYLLLGSSYETSREQSPTTPRTELPNTNPTAPPVPTPVPQTPK